MRMVTTGAVVMGGMMMMMRMGMPGHMLSSVESYVRVNIFNPSLGNLL